MEQYWLAKKWRRATVLGTLIDAMRSKEPV